MEHTISEFKNIAMRKIRVEHQPPGLLVLGGRADPDVMERLLILTSAVAEWLFKGLIEEKLFFRRILRW